MLELQRVADNDGAASAEQQRQRGGDVALAGFVDDEQVEEGGLKGEAAAGGEGGDGPAGEELRDLREELVVTAEDFAAGAFVEAVAAGDDLEKRDVLAEELAIVGVPARGPEAEPAAPEV